MKYRSLVFMSALGLALFAACRQSPPTPVAAAATNASSIVPYLTNAQPRLQTLKLFVGPEELTTELAINPVEIYTGMMWRTNMPEGEAMLFVFGQPHRVGFYMRNTYVPLSAAYVDPDGVILEIHDLHPRNETPVEAASDHVQYVIEVPQGWFKRHNINPGAVVRTQYGELSRTFNFKAP